MARKSAAETEIEADVSGPASVSVDGTQTVEHSLPDKIAADKYLRSLQGRGRRGCGVTFRKIVPHGSVQ